MLKKITTLVRITCFSAIALIVDRSTAQALTVSLSSFNAIDEYIYTLELADNEALYATDADSPTGNESFIRLSEMINVSNASIDDTAPFEITNQNTTTVELQPTQTIVGSQTFTNFLTVISPSRSGTIDYSTAHVDSTVFGSELDITNLSTVTGPSVAVPFEFSPGLGLLLMLGLLSRVSTRKIKL